MHLGSRLDGANQLGLTLNDAKDDVANWSIIANIFFDLPAQGVESTSSFITRSALQNMPYRIESTPECVQS